MKVPRIAISAGDPAGIGPDVVLQSATDDWKAALVVIADADMLATRAEQLGLNIDIQRLDSLAMDAVPHVAGTVPVLHEPLRQKPVSGVGNPANAASTLRALDLAVDGCVDGYFQAMVTAPVNKAVISDSGVLFSGHTEYLQERTRASRVVMLLTAAELRVALATTHMPLRDVPASLNSAELLTILRVMHEDLQEKFKLKAPRISVLGLNPHAGEGGYLGSEDQEVIAPALQAARGEGILVSGPWPADTAFNARLRDETDAYLAMYHDQGLPVLKYASFGAAVNVTLGLPIVRTSVDHGTAYELAGSGLADGSSFAAALNLAIDLAQR